MSLRATWFVILVCGCGATTEGGSGTDAGADAATSSDVGKADASFACGTMTCGAGQICTRTYTTGGACLSCGEDGGGCPTGMHCGGSCCVADTPSYGYACKTAPSGCSGTCATCGTSEVCGGGCPCESVSGSTVTCHCLAP